ncbi:MAG: hypothetical protein QOE80_2910 [Actinomycetota bacterium]|nr:hypothetical protein [Actinomycetota bacterium]
MTDVTATHQEDSQAEDRVRRVELAISSLLRIGVLTSLLVVLAGTVVTFVHHPHYLSSRHDLVPLTKPGAEFPHTVPSVIRGLEHSQGRAIVMAGLLLLIATPVLRVAISVLAFVYQRDRTFVVITTVVLALLLTSFVLGRGGG